MKVNLMRVILLSVIKWEKLFVLNYPRYYLAAAAEARVQQSASLFYTTNANCFRAVGNDNEFLYILFTWLSGP